jgi:hypothetical protein
MRIEPRLELARRRRERTRLESAIAARVSSTARTLVDLTEGSVGGRESRSAGLVRHEDPGLYRME